MYQGRAVRGKKVGHHARRRPGQGYLHHRDEAHEREWVWQQRGGIPPNESSGDVSAPSPSCDDDDRRG